MWLGNSHLSGCGSKDSMVQFVLSHVSDCLIRPELSGLEEYFPRITTSLFFSQKLHTGSKTRDVIGGAREDFLLLLEHSLAQDQIVFGASEVLSYV